MITQEYRNNRSQFPHAELAKYQGAWVAFSADGRRILASAESVEQLEEQIAARGENSQNVVLEWVPGAEDDSLFGAGEVLAAQINWGRTRDRFHPPQEWFDDTDNPFEPA